MRNLPNLHHSAADTPAPRHAWRGNCCRRPAPTFVWRFSWLIRRRVWRVRDELRCIYTNKQLLSSLQPANGAKTCFLWTSYLKLTSMHTPRATSYSWTRFCDCYVGCVRCVDDALWTLIGLYVSESTQPSVRMTSIRAQMLHQEQKVPIVIRESVTCVVTNATTRRRH